MAQPFALPRVFFDNGDEAVLRSASEQKLARNASRTLLNAEMCGHMDGEAVSLMVDAWRRVERSGAIAMRMLYADDGSTTSISTRLDAAAAEAAVRGLRECALAGCASKEVHVSQFKRCGACRTVAYCCRDHQLADWPAHKAACKAARKNTAGNT
jgi:hypothetical protein